MSKLKEEEYCVDCNGEVAVPIKDCPREKAKRKKLLWWPIITGEAENPEDDLVIGFSLPKEGYPGITLEQGHTLTTKEILSITGGAYSLKLELQKKEDK